MGHCLELGAHIEGVLLGDADWTAIVVSAIKKGCQYRV